jgi:tRNA(Ile)-lysidine synthase
MYNIDMQKTDKVKFPWPTYWERSEFVKNRQHSRKFYRECAKLQFDPTQRIIVCYSGGIDSTVLAHVLYSYSIMYHGQLPIIDLVYVNHQLRPDHEVAKDIVQVASFASQLQCLNHVIPINCEHNQASAREERYKVLTDYIKSVNGIGMLGHHKDDLAETKLFQFLTGRCVVGIAKQLMLDEVRYHRPLLSFTRSDIQEYARIHRLTWSEDCTNDTNEYARNRIRHELIPWIKTNINKGIVDTLSD